MKDYSLNPEERKQFITSYRIKNNEIIVKLASGENYVIPYNEQNEKKVLSRMEKQAENTTDIKNKLSKSNGKSRVFLLWSAALFTFLFLPAILLGQASVITYLGVSVTLLNIVLYSCGLIFNKLKQRDIAKQKYFLEHRQELNDNVNNNKNMLLGLSKKAKKQIEQAPVERPVFDINTIDSYSLKDIKTLRDNIQRELAFGFNQEQDQEQSIDNAKEVRSRKIENQ